MTSIMQCTTQSHDQKIVTKFDVSDWHGFRAGFPLQADTHKLINGAIIFNAINGKREKKKVVLRITAL